MNIYYIPQEFKFLNRQAQKLQVRDCKLFNEHEEIVKFSILKIQADYKYSTLTEFLNEFVDNFKCNVKVPFIAIGKEWFDVILYHKDNKTLPEEVKVGIDENGLYIEVQRLESSPELLIYCQKEKKFREATYGEFHTFKDYVYKGV